MKSSAFLSSPPPGTLTIQDAAHLANVTRQTIEDALNAGALSGITFIRRSPATAIPIEAVEEWINRRATQAGVR